MDVGSHASPDDSPPTESVHPGDSAYFRPAGEASSARQRACGLLWLLVCRHVEDRISDDSCRRGRTRTPKSSPPRSLRTRSPVRKATGYKPATGPVGLGAHCNAACSCPPPGKAPRPRCACGRGPSRAHRDRGGARLHAHFLLLKGRISSTRGRSGEPSVVAAATLAGLRIGRLLDQFGELR